METKEKVKVTPLGGRIWFSAIFFGLIGQIAWIVENMYFATFAQDVFSNSGRGDMAYIVTTLMVILSAISATVTTIFAGGLTDKVGKRKPFIALGYILWGITIMLFAFIPMKVETSAIAIVAVLLVLFDCVMTFAGSTSNDAAFNAWVADNTDETNRGRVNGILSTLPVIAVVIVFVGLGQLYSKENTSNWLFFVILGIIPIIAGIVGIFVIKDSPKLERSAITFKDTFQGFKLSVIKSHPIAYITLAAACLVGIAQQTFFSYLINFLIRTLNLGEGGFIVPMAVIIVGAAVITGVTGFLLDKYGRKHFYIPLLIMTVVGIFSFFLLQFTDGVLKTIVLYAGGVIMMGGLLSMIGALNANFQDNIPEDSIGRFQGVRMCFTVLIPMIIGPIVSLILGMDAMGNNGAEFVPPFSMFLAAAIIALLAFIPTYFVRKHSKR